MAAKEMYDYLTTITPDVASVTLSVTPQAVIKEEGDKNQKEHKFGDGTFDVVSLSDASFFNISLQWTFLTDANAGTIMDIWHDTAKANGRENTFYWSHPTDGHTYVVRFIEKLTTVRNATVDGYQEVAQIKLRVEGRQAD